MSTPAGAAFFWGFVGILFAAGIAYNGIWNALSYSIYLADVEKAKDMHNRRKR